MKIDLAGVLKRRGMRQSQLADEMEVSRGYISDLNSGKKRPSFEVLERIAEITGASAAELFGETGEPVGALSGFSEEAAAYEIPTPKQTAAQQAVKSSGHSQVMRAAKTHLGFGILKGDELYIDLSEKEGIDKIAVVTRADLTNGDAVTLIRVIRTNGLQGDDPADEIEPWSSDSHDYAVHGVIVGISRIY